MTSGRLFLVDHMGRFMACWLVLVVKHLVIWTSFEGCCGEIGGAITAATE